MPCGGLIPDMLPGALYGGALNPLSHLRGCIWGSRAPASGALEHPRGSSVHLPFSACWRYVGLSGVAISARQPSVQLFEGACIAPSGVLGTANGPDHPDYGL